MNDGGQAFPMHERDDALRGMSLRDYFAAKALAGFVSTTSGFTHDRAKVTAAFCAQMAYHVADALLAEREKDQSKTENRDSKIAS